MPSSNSHSSSESRGSSRRGRSSRACPTWDAILSPNAGCYPAAELPGGWTGGVDLPILFDEFLKPWMIPQGFPERIQPEERNREITGTGEEKLELVDGGVVLAHHHVDSGEFLHPPEPSPGLLAHRHQLHPNLPFTDRLFHPAQTGIGDAERTVEPVVLRLGLELRFQKNPSGVGIPGPSWAMRLPRRTGDAWCWPAREGTR